MSPKSTQSSSKSSSLPAIQLPSAQVRYQSLASHLQKNRPDMLISFARGLFFAAIVFTFLAGLIFTVIPLIRTVSDYFNQVITIPVNTWVEQEPVTGPMTMFLFYASGAMLVFYILRNHFHLAWLWIVMKFDELNKRWINQQKTRKVSLSGSNTVQLSRDNPPSR